MEGVNTKTIMWNLICQAWHSARQRGYRLAGAAMNLDNHLS
jgi:hypothetical protein